MAALGQLLQLLRSRAPSGSGATTFNARRQEYAGYVEQEGSLINGHVLVTGGFRVDGNSQFGEEVSPSWSVAIPITKISTTLRGSYSEGFRAPAFNELYYPDYGNPNLKPEISSEYDGGFTTNFGERASLTTTYFSRRVHNLIVTVPCPSARRVSSDRKRATRRAWTCRASRSCRASLSSRD